LEQFEETLFKTVEQHGYLHLREVPLKRKDGTIFPAEHSVMPIQNKQGSRTGWVGVVRDISERVRANEEALQHREQLAHIMRVASMGELTASLAHELNQPLTAVVSNAQAAQRFLASDEPDLDEVGGALADIAENGLRAAGVIRGLRALLRKGDLKQEPLDINQIVSEVVPLVESEAVLNKVSIDLQMADALPRVSGDKIQLEQVVLNLLLNGIEALSAFDSGARVLVVRTEQAQPQGVLLSVLDSGAGFDDQIQDRIFDAFFSTKPAGLGMGLTISRSIVRAHNGRIQAAQNPGGGAAFHVHLPACRGKQQ
jgi:C4-dicarboxylate-specific signal transduction histidine kinase